MVEEREIVIRAFIEGATLTEKGAPTYFYNITRKARRNPNVVKAQPQRIRPKVERPSPKLSDV